MDYESPFPGDIGMISLTRKCLEIQNLDWWESGVGGCITGLDGDGDRDSIGNLASQDRPGSFERGDIENEDEDDIDEEKGIGKEKRDGMLGKEARKLLWKSVVRTEKMEIQKSCTIVIESTIKHERKRVCQVDRGVWTGCDVSLLIS